MLGGLSVRHGLRTAQRFRTRKTALLFAYLALDMKQMHSRDALVELLWPEADRESGRASLRVALSALRRQLEPDAGTSGSVLLSDNLTIGLNSRLIDLDVDEFEAEIAAARQSPAQAQSHLLRAIELYSGELLPGFDEPWVIRRRAQLAAAHQYAVRRCAVLTEDDEEAASAVRPARPAATAAAEAFSSASEGGTSWGTPPPPRMRPRAAPVTLSDEPTPSEARSRTDLGALPLPLTRFFGREAETRAILAELERGTRLVTIAGAGGCGKTRLAIECARHVAAETGAQVLFVPLAEITQASAIPALIAETLELDTPPGESVLGHVARVLGRTPTLLVLDNMEQLVDSAAMLVRELLALAPGLACLVTSRAALGIAGERLVPLHPLPLPAAKDAAAILASNPGVELFLDRLHALQPDLARDERSIQLASRICARLEGVPLAIELAAGCATTLSLRQILSALDRRFDTLVSRYRDVPGRHRSLWAAVEWGYRLLSPTHQRFLLSLSVFHGGWTAEAARAVAQDPSEREMLADLHDRSFISIEPHDDIMRFTMLETTREFAALQLDQALQKGLADRHARYFADLAERASTALEAGDDGDWISRLEYDRENVRAAVQFLIGSDPGAALAMAGALAGYWARRSCFREAKERLAAVLALPANQSCTPARARAILGAAHAYRRLGEVESARALFEEGLGLFKQLGDKRGEASALNGLAGMSHDAGQYAEARLLLEQSMALRESMGDRRGVAYTLHNLGQSAADQGDVAAGRKLVEQSIQIMSGTGDSEGAALLMLSLAELMAAMGEPVAARKTYTEAARLARQVQSAPILANALKGAARIDFGSGDLATAHRLTSQSLTLFRGAGERPGEAAALALLGEVLLAQRDLAGARVHLREALDLYDDLGHLRDLGLLLLVVASLAASAGRMEDSAVLLGAEAALRGSLNIPVHASKQALLVSLREAAQSSLTPTIQTERTKEGEAMDRAAAVSFARSLLL